MLRQIHGWFPKSYIKLGTTTLPGNETNNGTHDSKTSDQQMNLETIGNNNGKMTNSSLNGTSSGEWFIVSNFQRI